MENCSVELSSRSTALKLQNLNSNSVSSRVLTIPITPKCKTWNSSSSRVLIIPLSSFFFFFLVVVCKPQNTKPYFPQNDDPILGFGLVNFLKLPKYLLKTYFLSIIALAYLNLMIYFLFLFC